MLLHMSASILERFSLTCVKPKLKQILWQITTDAINILNLNQNLTQLDVAGAKRGKICASTKRLVLMVLIG